MVALLTSDPIYRRPSDPPAALPVTPEQRHLRAVPELAPHRPPATDRAAAAHRAQACDARTLAGTQSVINPIWLVVALLALALALLAGFRTLQGPPPSGTWSDVQQASSFEPPAPGVGDGVVTVQPGQTLWGIAADVAPGEDRREVVQILTAANGGASIWAGQDLVIPAVLLSHGGVQAAG